MKELSPILGKKHFSFSLYSPYYLYKAMIIAINPKITLLAATVLLVLPINLFGQILEREGITLEIRDTYYCSKSRCSKLKINPVKLNITNKTDSTLTVNTKSILNKYATKDPIIIEKYRAAKNWGFKNHTFFCVGGHTLISAINYIEDTRINAYVGAAIGLAASYMGKKIFENILISMFFDYNPNVYCSYTEVAYCWGFFTQQYPWQVTINSLESKDIIILLDETCKKFTFDVYKESENSTPERIRFAIKLEDNPVNYNI